MPSSALKLGFRLVLPLSERSLFIVVFIAAEPWIDDCGAGVAHVDWFGWCPVSFVKLCATSVSKHREYKNILAGFPCVKY